MRSLERRPRCHSVLSLNHSGRFSHPGTPSSKVGAAWEGVESARVFTKDSTRSRESLQTGDMHHDQRPLLGAESASELAPPEGDVIRPSQSICDETQANSSGIDRAVKKLGSASSLKLHAEAGFGFIHDLREHTNYEIELPRFRLSFHDYE